MSRPPNRRGAPPAGNEGAPFEFIALGSNDYVRGGAAMSERVLSIVRDRRFDHTTLKHVLKRLAWEAADGGSQVIVSIDTLADDCQLVSNTVQRALRKAEELGLLHLVNRERGRWPRVYSLDLEALLAHPLTRVGRRRAANARGAP